MQKTPVEIENIALNALIKLGVDFDIARSSAESCRFLEGVGYPGLKLLCEALTDPHRSLDLRRDEIGLDLQNVSCVFIAHDIAKSVATEGRVFLRNVRHGLYLLPVSVNMNIGIGCPVDPGFALGGERTKNPYAEKLALAEVNGVLVDDEILRILESL
jgi:hypothetical protein